MAIRRASAVIASLVVAVAAFGTHPGSASAASNDLRNSAVSTYELQPDRGVVHVTTAITLTNKVPSTTKHRTCQSYAIGPYGGVVQYSYECGTRTIYYYNWYELW